MFAYFVIPAIFFGIIAAYWIVGYTMVYIECPYQRVAFLLTVLASEVAAVILAFVLLPPLVYQVLVTFSLTTCAIWSIMKHSVVINYQLPKE